MRGLHRAPAATLALAIGVSLLAAVASAGGPTATILEPKAFVRTTATPVTVNVTFNVPAAGAATLHVQNGVTTGGKTAPRVSSASINLNGMEIVTPASFSQVVAGFDVPIKVTAGANALAVIVRSPPGSALTLSITTPADKTVLAPVPDPIRVGDPLALRASVTGLGLPVVGATVRFETDAFAGVSPISSVTDASGIAEGMLSGFGEPGKGNAIASVVDTAPALTANVPFEVIPRMRPPKAVTISGTIDAFQRAQLDPSSLRVVTFLEQKSLDPDFGFTIAAIDEGQGQMVFVVDAANNSVAITYLTADRIGPPLHITAEDIGVGLIMLNPYLMVLPKEQIDAVAGLSRSHARMAELTSMIEAAIATEPEHLLEYAINPQVFQLAMTISIDILSNPPMAARYALAAATVGNELDPHLEDKPGPDITLVNPLYAFYGFDIATGGGTHLGDVLMAGRSGYLSIQWGWIPKVILTPPDRQDYPLGNGSFTVTAFKGFNRSEPGWLDPRAAAGQATLANFFYTVDIVIKWCWWSPLDKGDIKWIVSRFDDDGGTIAAMLTELASELGNDWFAFLKRLIQKTAENWEAVAKQIFLADVFPNADAVAIHDIGTKLLPAVKNALVFLKAVDGVNKQLPFLIDVVNGPPKLVYGIDQSDGALSEVSRAVPPNAEMTVNPTRPIVAQATLFDASGSTDDRDPATSLEVRWDFDGDGAWDTTWNTAKTISHAYTQSGFYSPRVQVRDRDGLIGSSFAFIYVESDRGAGSARRIKLFRNRRPWDSSSQDAVLGLLGFTPGTGEKQYKVFDSSQMATVVMEPGVDLVWISNDQDQTFYNQLAASSRRFENFLANGGTLFFGACDLGWGMGSMSSAGVSLPSGVSYSYLYDNYNYVVDYSTDLTKGLPSTLYGTYASHEGFSNLPAKTKAYVTNSVGLPTLVEYPSGTGWVLMTGQPLEYHYDRHQDPGPLFGRVVTYSLGLPIEDVTTNALRALAVVPKEELPSHLPE